MGALFMLVIFLLWIGVAYPAFLTGVWLFARVSGSKEKFSDFMDRF